MSAQYLMHSPSSQLSNETIKLKIGLELKKRYLSNPKIMYSLY